MKTTPHYLDLYRLEKVRHSVGKITARCPACAEIDGDRKGNHLTIFLSGKFACAANPGDSEHRRRIFALVGTIEPHIRDVDQAQIWREKQVTKHREVKKRQLLNNTIREKRSKIIARYKWSEYDVWEESPKRIDTDMVESDPRWFLQSLFPLSAILWTGEVHESGQNGRYANRWQTCSELINLPNRVRIGPMTTPAIWTPGCSSRTSENVISSPYTVLDFDGIDGKKPETMEQMQQHISDSLAITNWIKEGLHWSLAAIIWTGGKSLHAWFHNPGEENLESLRLAAQPLGLDAGLIGHPEHPCRLPGQRHAKTGKPSRVLWLQLPPY